ncbi:MAG TPA: calcium/sodium antiporter [Dehalococcoidia bacterium]|nr:calcium/sodium antiporter [Dehalococcoidia bacterium]
MIPNLIHVAIGLAVLISGAWLTVRSASTLAASFGLSRVVIGATVVAFGTSAPEFVVSLFAATHDATGIAVGNVLGSNVANVALVLGISALVAPMTVHWRLLRWEIPLLGGATLVTVVFAADGVVERWEGLLMFAGLVGFIALSPRLFPEAVREEADEAVEQAPALSPGWRGGPLEGLLLVLGLIALTLGADQAVRGAVSIAENIGISEIAIGATIVATGTSLPEVATSVVAAVRREHEIAVANVVGSNLFNLLGVVGLTAGIVTLEVDQDLFRFEIPALVLSTLVLLPLVWPRYRIARPEGALLVVLYVAFVVAVLVRS